MHILDLPDDCLIHLLNPFLPRLTSFIEKSFVHPRFSNAVGQSLRAHQKSLKLFDTRLNVEHFRENIMKHFNFKCFPDIAIKSDETTEDYVVVKELIGAPIDQLLTSFFYEITNLMVYSLSVSHFTLIHNFKNLSTLSLMELPDSHSFHKQLWSTLNGMPLLRHLHIFCINLLIPLPNELPLLKQLESFTLHNYGYPNLAVLLAQLSTNCKVIRVRPLSYEMVYTLIRNMTKGERICQNITHLDVRVADGVPYPDADLAELISTNFPLLTYLDSQFYSGSHYENVFSHFATLEHLTELRLCAELIIPHHSEFSSWNKLQMRSIRVIYLSKMLNFHHQLSSFGRKFLSILTKPLSKIEGHHTKGFNLMAFPALEEVYFDADKYEHYKVIMGIEKNENIEIYWKNFIKSVQFFVPEDALKRFKVHWTCNGVVQKNVFVMKNGEDCECLC